MNNDHCWAIVAGGLLAALCLLGAVGFEAPPQIRADQIIDKGVRLPYLKFPRNPVD